VARPSDYTDEIAATICSRIATGEPLVRICRDESMPGTTTVYRWLSEKEEFRDIYARARDDQADTLADEIIDLSDEQMEDATAVNRQRLRVDARKWIAAKLKPRKYGDKLDIEHKADVKISVVSYGASNNPT
jgi:hypothetical protein